MPKYTWPTFTGFWAFDKQYYYARVRNGKYEVRNCCNYDCAAYVNQTEFYREKGPYSPWHPLTLVSSETITCSIPKDLEGAINDLVKWKNTGASPSGSTQYYITNVEHALSKALQGQCELHTSKQRMDDLKEAEELLIKVCEYTDQTPNNASHCMLDGASQIEGLKEWWAKHKPKTDREKKLEKVVCALSLDGTMYLELIPVAERVLKALEE